MPAADDLLKQFELILGHDPLIDEVGFLHPSQFASLDEDSPPDSVALNDGGSGSGGDAMHFDKNVFWNKEHKLAISMDYLPQLYRAALIPYLAARTCNRQSRDSNAEVSSTGNGAATEISDEVLGTDVLRHSKAVLILNPDFLSVWNSRKLVLSRNNILTLLIDELQLSALVLSYSPKCESSWSHRRWVIKMVSKKFQDLWEIIDKESELVKKIAEKSKMNYRAWTHRCWLVHYMARTQVLDELNKSREWTELHVADNCCFHFRRCLLLRILEDCMTRQVGEASSDKYEICFLWKEELNWNQKLIKRYIGREALWVHRRFLSLCWIKHFLLKQEFCTYLENGFKNKLSLDVFWAEELQLLRTCLDTPADEYEDTRAQVQLAASYILLISKQAAPIHESELQEKFCEAGDLKAILMKACPEKNFLWKRLLN